MWRSRGRTLLKTDLRRKSPRSFIYCTLPLSSIGFGASQCPTIEDTVPWLVAICTHTQTLVTSNATMFLSCGIAAAMLQIVIETDGSCECTFHHLHDELPKFLWACFLCSCQHAPLLWLCALTHRPRALTCMRRRGWRRMRLARLRFL